MGLRLFCGWLVVALADIEPDLVVQVPGFEQTPFKVYSGLLDVPGPINGFSSLKIHYQFHTSQRDPSSDPVVTWHQGGPGSSTINIGLYTETGYFQVSDQGVRVNEYAWNREANMLYLDSPAGSGREFGYSLCMGQADTPVACSWNDTSQAEAYAHTLQAFFHAFPEFGDNDLYLTGESYFGIYGPNIANFITSTEPFNSNLNLKGIALGNSCFGGDETSVSCNGVNYTKNIVELFFRKNFISPKSYAAIQAACPFPDLSPPECATQFGQIMEEVGPYDEYNVYNNCPDTEEFLDRTGKNMTWLSNYLREGLADPHGTHAALVDLNGGYNWACGGQAATEAWIQRSDVRAALHLDIHPPGNSTFQYRSTGPASAVLYPSLAQKMRILLYSGDADACVPYPGTEEFVDGLETQGVIKESAPWAPWFASNVSSVPAGYVTEYGVSGSDMNLTFATVRLAGHMVPAYMPDAAFTMISRWLSGQSLRQPRQPRRPRKSAIV